MTKEYKFKCKRPDGVDCPGFSHMSTMHFDCLTKIFYPVSGDGFIKCHYLEIECV